MSQAFRSAAVEDMNPVKIASDVQTGRCSLYNTCIGYSSSNPYDTRPLCHGKHVGKRGYCGLATSSWQVAPEGHD
jgi:hypothetical protein